MSKKTIDTSQITNELQASRFFAEQEHSTTLSQTDNPASEEKTSSLSTRKTTPNSTSKRDSSRTQPRQLLRESSREKRLDYPTRDEIQEFSFQLRDSLKVKVQAEVPHEWQDELEDIARDLKVKKLELYRYILGEFLGKVRRKTRT